MSLNVSQNRLCPLDEMLGLWLPRLEKGGLSEASLSKKDKMTLQDFVVAYGQHLEIKSSGIVSASSRSASHCSALTACY